MEHDQTRLVDAQEGSITKGQGATNLDDTGEANGTGYGCCDKICGGETAEKAEGVDGPGIQRPLPLTLRVPPQGAPKGEKLDGEDRVEKGSYEGCG